MNEEGEKEESAWDAEISGRKRLFVLNYCTDSLCFLNGRQSYIAAYSKTDKDGNVTRPTDESADVCASKLLRSAKVRQAVRKLLLMSQQQADVENSHLLLRDLVLLATYNPADIITSDGQLKVENMSELGDLAKCIESLERTKFGVRVKLANRSRAQEKLLRYYGLTGDNGATGIISRSVASDEWEWTEPDNNEEEEKDGWD